MQRKRPYSMTRAHAIRYSPGTEIISIIIALIVMLPMVVAIAGGRR